VIISDYVKMIASIFIYFFCVVKFLVRSVSRHCVVSKLHGFLSTIVEFHVTETIELVLLWVEFVELVIWWGFARFGIDFDVVLFRLGHRYLKYLLVPVE